VAADIFTAYTTHTSHHLATKAASYTSLASSWGNPKYGVLDLAAHLATGTCMSFRSVEQDRHSSHNDSNQNPVATSTASNDRKNLDHRPTSGTPHPSDRTKPTPQIVNGPACLLPSHEQREQQNVNVTRPSLHPPIHHSTPDPSNQAYRRPENFRFSSHLC
jgi:hypothetical protein